MSEEYQIVDGLRVAFVEQAGDQILVDVYGGADRMCGTVRYTFPDRVEREERYATLARWGRDDTTITFIRRGRQVTLLDERSLMRRALPEASAG